MNARDRRRAVIIAGHCDDEAVIDDHVADDDPNVRAAVLTALERGKRLTADQVEAAMNDIDPIVRRQAAELAAKRPGVSLDALLADDDPTVVEIAAWACGEQEAIADTTLQALITLATDADDPLVREACAAALGAIGDPRGLPAVLAACADKPHVRRRAVLALAPFEGPAVDAAVERALEDRDWQVRQAAEDLRRAAGDVER